MEETGEKQTPNQPTGANDVERGDEGGLVEALPRHLLPHEERLREPNHARRRRRWRGQQQVNVVTVPLKLTKFLKKELFSNTILL